MEYCRQTTYQAITSKQAVVTGQPALYRYLRFNAIGNSNPPTESPVAVADTTPAPSTELTEPSEDPTMMEPLRPGQDISDGISYNDNIFFEDLEDEDAHTVFADINLSSSAKDTLKQNKKVISKLTTSLDTDYMLKQLYHVNDETGIDKDIFDVQKLLTSDVTIEKNANEPQILIFHTHAHEWFIDSREGKKSDTIVGVGAELARILKEDYGYNVIHYAAQYSAKTAYNQALPDIKAILKKYPSIKVVLDIHRDGVSEGVDTHTTINMNDETMAKLMFFNGVCQTKKGPIEGYQNKNLQMNLAMSLQMRLYAMETFPQLTKYNFLKSWRYNMHLMPRYSLIEVGDNNNTVAEAKAAMKPLANIIDHVLTTKCDYIQ